MIKLHANMLKHTRIHTESSGHCSNSGWAATIFSGVLVPYRVFLGHSVGAHCVTMGSLRMSIILYMRVQRYSHLWTSVTAYLGPPGACSNNDPIYVAKRHAGIRIIH